MNYTCVRELQPGDRFIFAEHLTLGDREMLSQTKVLRRTTFDNYRMLGVTITGVAFERIGGGNPRYSRSSSWNPPVLRIFER